MNCTVPVQRLVVVRWEIWGEFFSGLLPLFFLWFPNYCQFGGQTSLHFASLSGVAVAWRARFTVGEVLPFFTTFPLHRLFLSFHSSGFIISWSDVAYLGPLSKRKSTRVAKWSRINLMGRLLHCSTFLGTSKTGWMSSLPLPNFLPFVGHWKKKLRRILLEIYPTMSVWTCS